MLSFLKRRTKKDSRDIEQVIFDIAEHNREADFVLFYRLMSTREVYVPVERASLPSAAEAGLPYTTQAADELKVKTASIPDNGDWIPAATQASHPVLEGSCVGMRWLEFLKTAREGAGVRGALIQGQTSWIALDKEHISHILGYSQNLPGVNDGSVTAQPQHKPGGTSWMAGSLSQALADARDPSDVNDGPVTVPPGHKVVGILPTARPQVRHLESNLLVMDFGVDGDWRTFVSGFDERLGRVEVPTTVAILQGAMLDRLRAAGELREFVAAWQRLAERGWQAVWVLPREAAGQVDAVELLGAAGFDVHGSAEDGMCFVELHKPDGTINIGLPGPSLR